jgi:hypothetical protein
VKAGVDAGARASAVVRVRATAGAPTAAGLATGAAGA